MKGKGADMVIKEELHKVVVDLERSALAHVDISGFTVTIRLIEGAQKVFLSTPVYFGGNFIPHSVRRSISEKPHFDNGALETGFLVDEDQFRIDLHYKGDAVSLECAKVNELLNEYGWLADQWREHLDEHDKNDLIHVRT